MALKELKKDEINPKKEFKLYKNEIPEQKIHFDVEKIKKIGKNIVIGTIGVLTLVGFFKYNAHRDDIIARATAEPQQVISLIEEDTNEFEVADISINDTLVDTKSQEVVPNEKPNEQKEPVKNYMIIGDALDINKLIEGRTSSINELTDYVENITNERISCKKDEYSENLTEERYKAYKDASDESGIDIDLLIAMAKQENGLKNISTKYAKGPMQIENPNLKNVYQRYNYKTQEDEIVKFGNMNLEDYVSNVKAGSIMLSKTLEKYDYNMLFAIQAYNYGDSAFDIALKMAKKELDKSEYELTYEEVKPYIKYIHDNPQKTISSKWSHSTYGDHLYVENVRRYPQNKAALNKIKKDNKIMLVVYSWDTGRAIKKYTCVNEKENIYRDEENNIYFFYNDILDIVVDTNEKAKSY